MAAWKPKRRATALAAALGVVTLYLAPTWLYPLRLVEGAVGSSVAFTIVWDVLWAALCIAMLRQTGALAPRSDDRPHLTVADVLLFTYVVVSVFLVGNLAGTSILYQTGDVAFVNYAERLSGAETVMQVVLTCCVAPVAEELLMRGVVFGALRERWSFLASALVSAVLFVGLHGTLVHVPLTFLLGLFGMLMVAFALYRLALSVNESAQEVEDLKECLEEQDASRAAVAAEEARRRLAVAAEGVARAGADAAGQADADAVSGSDDVGCGEAAVNGDEKGGSYGSSASSGSRASSVAPSGSADSSVR